MQYWYTTTIQNLQYHNLPLNALGAAPLRCLHLHGPAPHVAELRILLAGTQLLLHCTAEHPKASLRASVPHDGKSRIDENQRKGAKLKPTCIIDVHQHFFNLFHLVSNAVFVKLLTVRTFHGKERYDMPFSAYCNACGCQKFAFKKARRQSCALFFDLFSTALAYANIKASWVASRPPSCIASRHSTALPSVVTAAAQLSRCAKLAKIRLRCHWGVGQAVMAVVAETTSASPWLKERDWTNNEKDCKNDDKRFNDDSICIYIYYLDSR